ncbi:hypothetical protein [Novosphingobium sp. P6W]|uniref:hypothetical protein n=1 Tax=Novosphingobium sp. P6W TaxID=1609758 RepID=UPI0005C311F7|nr:hypothetical protein [Novosphingobium sp. P6W]KIS29428.1 hypothetical protein TQ38_28805 [Novosphingobium sp. P6W]
MKKIAVVAMIGGLLQPVSAIEARPTSLEKPLKIARQGSFFIGGRDVSSAALGEIKPYPSSGQIVVDQIYVRFQIPDGKTRSPILLIHGCCLTGAAWETTPDGRSGWDELFVRMRHPVYVMDQAWRGRSAFDPTIINEVREGRAPVNALPVVTSASKEAAWEIFRLGPRYPIAHPGLKYPVAALSALWAQMVPNVAPSLDARSPTVEAISALSQREKGLVVVSHSQSGIYPFLATKAGAKEISAIIAIEPASCPAVGQFPDRSAQPRILVVFGDYIAQSERWLPRLEACRKFVDSAKAAGLDAVLVELPKVGVFGNSHMMMQDTNSAQVATIIDDWLAARHL